MLWWAWHLTSALICELESPELGDERKAGQDVRPQSVDTQEAEMCWVFQMFMYGVHD